MKVIFWVLFIGLIFGGFFYFKTEVNRQSFKAFIIGKDIQILPTGEIITLEKTEVFILSDDKTYMFKGDCHMYLNYFREHPQNMPHSVLKRCLIE